MPARKRRTISLATIDRILLKANSAPADIAAADALGEVLEQVAGEILETAKVLTKYAGRKTINDADIALAYGEWKKKVTEKRS
ncbi:MAG: NFYB/HAP3 family transcription factor subunit [Candidatus Lokiarchaeota archaeon]|nr:NFYB/HAP3 family transcription factor subunit [Candidatus Lokiarchaeota archaeon]